MAPPLPHLPPGEAANFQSRKPSFWVGESAKANGPCMSPSWLRAVPPSMFSIVPRSRRGRRQRRAGTEAHYHANYYAAFVLDLNGNNIEALCHGPE